MSDALAGPEVLVAIVREAVEGFKTWLLHLGHICGSSLFAGRHEAAFPGLRVERLCG